MKTTLFLTRQMGENSTTERDIVAPWTGQDVDLSAQVMCCLCYDDDRLVPVWKYGFRWVDLPDWMDLDRYPGWCVHWSYLLAHGADPEWPESWLMGLMFMRGDAARVAICKLLRTKKFRSAFRQSLRDQVVAWLETPREDRKHASPLSERQVQPLIQWDDIRCAKNRAPMAGRAVWFPGDGEPVVPERELIAA